MRLPMRQMRVEDPETARVLLHPARSRILARLRAPASATEVARALGEPPPRVNHHVRRLRDAGLVRRAGTRRIRNLTEVLYVAMARTFVIGEGATPGGEERRKAGGTTKRRTLLNLVSLGERLAADSLALLDEAVTEDREISAYATSVELRFADANARAAFLADLLEAVRSLKARYGATAGDPAGRYRAVIACYPELTP
ncbi:MAG: helix-turn-helix domain-containing protein [Candidatus Eiseniibacteriota bacterium]